MVKLQLQLQLQKMLKNLQQMQYQEMLSKRHNNQQSTRAQNAEQAIADLQERPKNKIWRLYITLRSYSICI